MIKAEQLSTYFENGLNSFYQNAMDTQQNEFVIFSDIGDFEKYHREQNTNNLIMKTNGVLSLGTNNILNIKGYQCYTQSMQINFIIDCEQIEETEALKYPKVQEIKNILNNYFMSRNGQSMTMEESGVNFEITTNYNGLQVGQASIQSELGLCVEIAVFCELVIFEIGVNSNTVEWLVQNMPLNWDSYSVTKKREIESSPVNNENDNKALAQSNGLSFNFTLPFLKTDLQNIIEDDRYTGESNQCFLLTRKRGTKENNYLCILPSNSESGELGKNIGVVLNFVEGFENGLKYDLFNIDESINEFIITGLVVNKTYKLWLLVNGKIFDFEFTNDNRNYTKTYNNATIYIECNNLTQVYVEITNTLTQTRYLGNISEK